MGIFHGVVTLPNLGLFVLAGPHGVGDSWDCERLSDKRTRRPTFWGRRES